MSSRKVSLGFNAEAGADMNVGGIPTPKEINALQLGTAIYLLECFMVDVMQRSKGDARRNSQNLATEYAVFNEYEIAKQQVTINKINGKLGNG